MKPELKEFLLRLLNDKANIEESFAAFINANFAAYLQDNFALLIAVKKITDPTDNLLDIGKHTRDPEEIANVSSSQQAAAVLLFIEHCYSEVSKTKDYSVAGPYLQVLGFFTEKLKDQPKILEAIQTTFPNFIKIIKSVDGLYGSEQTTSPKEASNASLTAAKPVITQNNTAQRNKSEKDTSLRSSVQIAEEKAHDPSGKAFTDEYEDIKSILLILLAKQKKSFFRTLVNDPLKNPHLHALLTKYKDATFNLDTIKAISDDIVKSYEHHESPLDDSNPKEKETYRQILGLMLEKLKTEKDSAPDNKQLEETYNAIRINVYKVQTLNNIDAYIDNRKGITKYYFNDIYYRATNTGENPPFDSQKYKTENLFAFDTKIQAANTAEDYLEIIRDIQAQLQPFYDLKDATYHNQNSVSKALLHEIQIQTLAALRLSFPDSIDVIEKAELLVDNALFSRLKDDLEEYKKNRQKITSNPLGLLKDKLFDKQRIQAFNHVDWLFSILQTLSKNISTNPEKQFSSDEKISLYFQIIEACAYVLNQNKGRDSDLEDTVFNTQYNIIKQLLNELSNKSGYEKEYQRLHDILEYQKLHSTKARQTLRTLMSTFSLMPLKYDSNRTKTFAHAFEKSMQERYESWQTLTDLRRNKERIEFFKNDLTAYLRKGMNRLVKGKRVKASIFDQLAKGVAVAFPATPEAKIAVQATGAVYTGVQVVNPEILGNKPFESLTSEQQDKLITLLVDRFAQIYQQKIGMLHYDSSKDGKETINELAHYAAERMLYILEKTPLDVDDVTGEDFIESRKTNKLPSYALKAVDKVFNKLKSDPVYHSVIPLKNTTLRLQDEPRIIVNTGRGFDINNFFLHGSILEMNQNKEVVKQAAAPVSRRARDKSNVPAKMFFGYTVFWNPVVTTKPAENTTQVPIAATSPGPSL